MTLRSSFLALSMILPSAACDKTVGDAIRPDDHTAAGATGAELVCEGTPGRIKPLVVDWDPDERVDLEAAMKGSVVVVKYTCPSMEILPGCSVDGSYSYAGVSRKEQVIQMKNMDDVHANIPVSSGSVGGEIKAGKAIDLATVLVGRQSTTVNHLPSDLLQGQCDGATHFVRSASLGAFAMGTGSVGKAAVVAEMFGVGGGASSESERSALNKDGNLDACRDSDPGADAPPSECQAPVRIELMPIADASAGVKASDVAESSKKAAAENPCLPGYVFSDGMCTRPAADLAITCDPEDEAECKAQCDKGSAESCLNYGRLASAEQAMIPFKKACEAEIWEACTALGDQVYMDVDYDVAGFEALIDTAFEMVSQGCDGGDGYGCELKGDIYADTDAKQHDKAKAFKTYMRSCDLGSSFGCYAAANQQLDGDGIPADVAGGVKTLARSCQGGNSDECMTLGHIFYDGKYELSVDKDMALKLYGLSCGLDWAYCESAGERALASGKAEIAASWFAKDCKQMEDGGSDSCGQLGIMYLEGTGGLTKDEAKGQAMLDKACTNGHSEIACKKLGKPVPE